MPQVCEICRDPESPALEKLFTDKRISAYDIKEQKGWDTHKWYKHIKEHLTPQVFQALSTSAEILAQRIVDKVETTIKQLDRLEANVEKAQKMLGYAPDPSMIKAYTSLEAQLTRTTEFLAKLQGDFREASIIKANNVTLEFNNVIGTVIQEACPACKVKFAEKLPNILKINENDTRTNL